MLVKPKKKGMSVRSGSRARPRVLGVGLGLSGKAASVRSGSRARPRVLGVGLGKAASVRKGSRQGCE